MPNVQTKRKKKKNRKRKIRRTVTVLLLLIIAAVCLCLFTPFFNISSISVAGNEQVASEDILARCGILENTNIFRINKKASRASLESLAYLDTIKIKRKLPNKVVIEVTETTASLLFPFMTGYIVTDSTGKVLEQTTDAEAWDLPQILGADNRAASAHRIEGLNHKDIYRIYQRYRRDRRWPHMGDHHRIDHTHHRD